VRIGGGALPERGRKGKKRKKKKSLIYHEWENQAVGASFATAAMRPPMAMTS